MKNHQVAKLKNNIKIKKTKIPYEIVERRAGDVASVYTCTKLAKKELNWDAKLSLNDSCIKNNNNYLIGYHSWNYQNKYRQGN